MVDELIWYIVTANFSSLKDAFEFRKLYVSDILRGIGRETLTIKCINKLINLMSHFYYKKIKQPI